MNLLKSLEQSSDSLLTSGRIFHIFFILFTIQVMRNLSEKHQTLLFSATMPEEIEGLAQVQCFANFLVLRAFVNHTTTIRYGKAITATSFILIN